MTKSIDLKGYTLPAAVGETVRHNHDRCPAGMDTRQRLYITRHKPHLFLGYCHNCSGAGVLRNVGGVLRAARKLDGSMASVSVESTEPEKLPDDTLPLVMASETMDGVKEAVAWLDKCGINQPFTRFGNVLAWSPSMRRLIVKDGTFWTARDCRKDAPLKWYSPANHKKPVYPLSCFCACDPANPELRKKVRKVLVLVEDPISALRVADTELASAFCLYGTHLSDESFAAICADKEIDKVFIWLDKDEAGVRGARVITKKFQLAGKRAGIITTHDEPKRHGTDAIKRILNGR